LDEESGGDSGESTSELEKDMLVAFEEQEKELLGTTPSSPCHSRHSTRPPDPDIDPELDQSRTTSGRFEGRGDSSPLCSQDQEEEEPQRQPPEQQRQEVDSMEEGEDEAEEDDGGERVQETRGEKRHRQGWEEVGSGTHDSDDCGHDTDVTATRTTTSHGLRSGKGLVASILAALRSLQQRNLGQATSSLRLITDVHRLP
jgi:hypothetical protein